MSVETLLEAEQSPAPPLRSPRRPRCVCALFAFGFISIDVTSLSAKTRHHEVLPARRRLVSIFTWLLARCGSQLQQFFEGCSVSSGTSFCVCVCVFLSLGVYREVQSKFLSPRHFWTLVVLSVLFLFIRSTVPGLSEHTWMLSRLSSRSSTVAFSSLKTVFFLYYYY